MTAFHSLKFSISKTISKDHVPTWHCQALIRPESYGALSMDHTVWSLILRWYLYLDDRKHFCYYSQMQYCHGFSLVVLKLFGKFYVPLLALFPINFFHSKKLGVIFEQLWWRILIEFPFVKNNTANDENRWKTDYYHDA